MAILKRFRNLKSQDNTGFGNLASDSGTRFLSRTTQSANVQRRGVGILSRFSWYHTMLGMKRTKFLLLIFSVYIIINLIFAAIYYLIGIEHLGGVNAGSPLKNFTEVFFFSTQTFTTVGYGRISPIGFAASFVATFEAFLGLLGFAIATGLFYGRFSRPQAFIRFSKNALIAPYKDGMALMFRMSPYKNNTLSEVNVKVTLAMQVEENGKFVNRFYDLPLEISSVNAMALSWTIVHAITDSSPLYGITRTELSSMRLEVLPFIKAFDDVFSNTVMTRYSYVTSEIIWGAKFKMMFYPNENKTKTILDLNLLNEYETVQLPDTAGVTTG